jgi:hypothetical protein
MRKKAILRRLRHAQAMEGVSGQGWLAIHSRDIPPAAWRVQAKDGGHTVRAGEERDDEYQRKFDDSKDKLCISSATKIDL